MPPRQASRERSAMTEQGTVRPLSERGQALLPALAAFGKVWRAVLGRETEDEHTRDLRKMKKTGAAPPWQEAVPRSASPEIPLSQVKIPTMWGTASFCANFGSHNPFESGQDSNEFLQDVVTWLPTACHNPFESGQDSNRKDRRQVGVVGRDVIIPLSQVKIPTTRSTHLTMNEAIKS